MTDVIPDPLQEFLAQDPTALVDPTILAEQDLVKQEEAVRSDHGVTPVAVGLGAAYLVYRTYMARRMKEVVVKKGGDVDHRFLLAAASLVWNSFIPRWVSMTAPYLVAGYLEGIKDANAGNVPPDVLRTIARGYAEELGNHINQVSADAVVSGFNAQVNRKVPPFLAAKRVSDAYGVPKRGMNALVNVWMSEEKARVSDRPLPSSKEERSKALIAAQNTLRARQVGDNEEWAARTQAKQIVWMYGVDKGTIPSNARRVWITADDERVCEVCGPLDGKAAPVGEQFKTSLGKFWTPPTHINCRCDVALDLSETGDIQDEITALLESETVAKAVGADPYDRDPRGRFARDEGRSAKPFKEREAAVDDLLAQVNQALTGVPLTEQKLERPSLKRPSLSLARPSLSGPSLSLIPLTSDQTSQKPGINIRRRLHGPELKAKLRASIGADLQSGLWKLDRSVEPIKTRKGTWETLDHDLVAIIPHWDKAYDTVGLTDDVYEADSQIKWYVSPYGDVGDADPRHMDSKPLYQALYEYWQDVTNELINDYQTMSREKRTYFDRDGTGMAYVIDRDAYETVIEHAINGVKDPGAFESSVFLHGYGENNEAEIEVSTVALADYLDVYEEIEQRQPKLLVANHGLPGATTLRSDGTKEVWANPGRWLIKDSAQGQRAYAHYTYDMHYVVPEDFDEDD